MMECGPETADGQKGGGGQRFYGKYRGKVVSVKDPLNLGRIMAIVPSVSQLNPTSWAYPCSPFAGLGVGMFYVPLIGANVWIEFEEGNLEHPIWTGGFWDEKDLAPIIPNPFFKPGDFTISTLYGKIALSDLPPRLTLSTKDEKKICLDTTGIEISYLGAKIKMSVAGDINIFSATNTIIIKSSLPLSINSPV